MALRGHVETYSPTLIGGWAFDDDSPTAPVDVDIRIDGVVCARVRADLPTFGGRVPRCGFALRLPDELQARRRRAMVSVEFAGTGATLTNAPRPLVFGRKTPRIAAWLTAGRRAYHDEVLPFANTPAEHIASYNNIGDLMVYDSSLKLLSFSEMRSFNCFDWSDADVAQLNANYDYCILRGSNYLHAKTNWRDIASLLARVKIPVIPFSVGAQAPRRRKLEVPAATIDVWKAFADHCGTIGVRGAHSAEIFADIGIHNVEIIGCPSLFRANDPYLQIVAKPLHAVEKITFSLRREIATTYTPDVDRYLRLQRKLILELAEHFDVCASVHGESHEKAFFYRDSDAIALARAELFKRKWFESEDDPLLRIYENQLFYAETVSQFDEMVRKKDLSIGFRVHGVLPAMANGIPAMGVSYDSRGAELYEALDVPTLTLDDIEQNSFSTLYDSVRFETFNRRFLGHYRRMRGWLERNGMAHNMIEV